MTTLTTHDTKRSEDVRARLMVLAEDGAGWVRWIEKARQLAAPHRNRLVDDPTEYLTRQTLVGTWPIASDRLEQYLLKAVREAKIHTAWVGGDGDYEQAVMAWVRHLCQDNAIGTHLDAWILEHQPSVRANTLAQKLVQLTMPGVPDVYQGCETVVLRLVDPDNRRPVDWTDRGERLERLLAGEPALDLDDEKLLVTARALRVRRDLPEVFAGENTSYAGLHTSSEHALAFARGDADGPQVVTVVTRGAGLLADAGGFGDSRVEIPTGRWREVLGGQEFRTDGSGVALRHLLADRPVALLVKQIRSATGS
jgi:(1->4)-alpha-D-glucan 1-alpha-D-glucosylmutase